MCKSIGQGGQRCQCAADRTTYNRRINNRAYRRDLAAEMNRQGDPDLATMVSKTSFTAIPDVLDAAGIDPSEVSIARMPDRTKRHALSEHDEDVLAQAKELGQRRREADEHLTETYGIRQFRSPEHARDEMDKLTPQERRAERERADHAVTELAAQGHGATGTEAATNEVRTAAAMRYADLINRNDRGIADVDRARMVTDAGYAADNPEALREMRSDELAQAWQTFSARSDEDQSRAIDLLAREAGVRNAQDEPGQPLLVTGSDGAVLSRVSDTDLRRRAHELRDPLPAGEGDADAHAHERSLVEQEMKRRPGMVPVTTYAQRTALGEFKEKAGQREALHVRNHHSKAYRDADDKTRWAAYEAVFPRDGAGHPLVASGQDKLSPMSERAQREQWEKSLEAQSAPGAPGRMFTGGQSDSLEDEGKYVDMPPEARNPSFWTDEYRDVVLGQGITTKAEYLRAERKDRIAPMNRKQRLAAWNAISQFTGRSRFYGHATPEAVKALNDHIKESEPRTPAAEAGTGTD